MSGHLFYSVSSWSDQIFEIKEIDSSDDNDNLFIANSAYANPSIVKVTPDGHLIVFATTNVHAGILDMTFDDHQILYVSNRSQETIHTLSNGVEVGGDFDPDFDLDSGASVYPEPSTQCPGTGPPAPCKLLNTVQVELLR